ncbi:MAG: ABC transporter ATP-binding protein [Desulfobacterales bacterium]
MIELDRVSKRFGRRPAVDRLSLTVGRGEIFGFIGPNGAGKTTTLRMLGGILAPDEGEIRIAGIPLARFPEEAKRRLGFIPDRPFLYEKLSAWEFLEFVARLRGVPPAAFGGRAQALLAEFSLSAHADEPIASFSHGMKQRLATAAALIHEPEALIVDEPLVGLDPRGVLRLKDLFRRLAAGGMTIFLSTHSLQVAEELCPRIGVIHRGRLIATGSPPELRRRAGEDLAGLEAAFLALTAEEDGGGSAAEERR